MKYPEEFWQWIDAHASDDTSKLRLSASKWNEPWISDAILQIECRRKAARKLPEAVGNKRFLFPTALSAEQSTSERLARFHARLVGRGEKVVDLTAGLGIDAMAIARVASHVSAVDINPEVADALTHNIVVTGHDNIDVRNEDCVDFLEDMKEDADVAFIDPARRGKNGERIFALADCCPDVIALLPQIKSHFKRLIIKASPMIDIAATMRDLPHAAKFITLGTHTECKELIAVVDFRGDTESDEALIEAVTLLADGTDSSFTFTRDEEAGAIVEYGNPTVGDKLFMPYPATIKAAPFKLLSERFAIRKLSGNTHLYVADSGREGFPGYTFTIIESLPYASKVIKKFASRYPRISVATRNFGMTADALRAKLKVKDGGDKRVIGVTLADGTRRLLVIG